MDDRPIGAPDNRGGDAMTRSTQRSGARRWLASLTMLALLAGAAFAPSAVAAAEPTNMVLVWNENAVNVISNPATATPPGLGQAPPLAALHLAMVHGAIYDAVNAIDGGHEPYLAVCPRRRARRRRPRSPRPPTMSCSAHAGGDTGGPDQDRRHADGVARARSTTARPRPTASRSAPQAAAAMLAARANDGRFDVEPFVPSDDLGEWRPVPPLNGNVFGQFATVKPLTLKSPDQFRTEGPPDLTSAQYAAEFNEVKALGRPGRDRAGPRRRRCSPGSSRPIRSSS